jgi:hypothetical protein
MFFIVNDTCVFEKFCEIFFAMDENVNEVDFNKENFIEEVKKHPNLWNTKMSEYRDSVRSVNTWVAIGKTFNITGNH